MRLYCHRCQADRATVERTDGTYRCFLCLSIIRCTDCGADYTADCGEGSVFVPALLHPAADTEPSGHSDDTKSHEANR